MYDILTLQAFIKACYAVEDQARLWLEPYSYPASFTAFNGASTGTPQQVIVQINANADFFMTRISYMAGLGSAITSNSLPVVQARLQITDTGSGNPFFASPMSLEAVAAHEYPERFLPMPRYLSANTSLQVQLTPIGTAAETFSYIDVILEGVRVRKYSSPNG